MTSSSNRTVVLLLAGLVLVGALPARAAVKLGRGLVGSREEDDAARLKGSERPLSMTGLKGLREQQRSALRPAKLENKADGKVLVATTTPYLGELKPIGEVRGQPKVAEPRLSIGEILRTNAPELLVVKALTAMGATHEGLARFAATQGQDGIQVGIGKGFRLGDSVSAGHTLPAALKAKPRRTPRRHRLPGEDASR